MLIVNNIAQFLQTSIKQTPSIKQTLGEVSKVSAYRVFTVSW